MDIEILIDQLNQAVAHHNEGRLAEAKPIYENILAYEQDPGLLKRGQRAHLVTKLFTQTNNNLGIVLVIQGEDRDARRHFRRALDWAPGNVDALINLGLVLERADNLEGARDVLEEALNLNDEFFKARLALARVERKLGNPGRAIEVLEEGRRISRRPDFDLELAFAYLAARRPEEALQAAEYASRHEALAEDAGNAMGQALQRLGRTEDARRAYEQGLAKNPQSAILRHNLALLDYESARLDEAAERLKKIIEDQPDFRQAYGTLAAILEIFGLTGEMKSVLKEGLRRFPRDRRLMLVQAKGHRHEENYQKALEALENIPEPKVEDATLYETLLEYARIHKSLGQDKQAELFLEQAREMAEKLPFGAPKDPGNLLAAYQARQGEGAS